MKEFRKGHSNSRASRTVDRYMIAICVLFIFALCSTSYRAAAQNPNLLDQMEQNFNELTDEALSWSNVSKSNTDIIALVERIGLRPVSAEWQQTSPQVGEIRFIDIVTPFPADGCMTSDDILTWYIIIDVYGGYDVKHLGNIDDWFLTITDKNGEIYTFGVQQDGDCVPTPCHNVDRYTFTFTWLYGESEIRLDANNFPNIFFDDPDHPDGTTGSIWDQTCDDLEKDYTFNFASLWMGCHNPCQQFTVSLVRRNLNNKSYVSPFPQGGTY
jgi:hypothetical protein